MSLLKRHPTCRSCGTQLIWERSIKTGYCLRCRLRWEQERQR
jgi:hypothetical protein